MKKILTIILSFTLVFSFITPAFAELKDTDPIVFTGEDARVLRNIDKLYDRIEPLYGKGAPKNEKLAYDFELYNAVPLIESGTFYYIVSIEWKTHMEDNEYPFSRHVTLYKTTGSKGFHEPWNPFATLEEFTNINSELFILNPYFYGKTPTQDEVNQWATIENEKQRQFAEEQKAAGIVFTNKDSVIEIDKYREDFKIVR